MGGHRTFDIYLQKQICMKIKIKNLRRHVLLLSRHVDNVDNIEVSNRQFWVKLPGAWCLQPRCANFMIILRHFPLLVIMSRYNGWRWDSTCRYCIYPVLLYYISTTILFYNEVQSARSRRLFVHVRTRDQGFNSRCRKLSSMFTLYRGGPRTTTWPGSGWAGQGTGHSYYLL